MKIIIIFISSVLLFCSSLLSQLPVSSDIITLSYSNSQLDNQSQASAEPIIDNISKSIFTSGETLRISGKNFRSIRNDSYVSFNNQKAEVYPQWKDNSILVVVPKDIESGKLSVWVDGAQSNEIDFIYQDKFKLMATVTINAGSFIMGDDNSNGFDNKPAHKVTLTYDFEISINEVTQLDWKTVMDGSNPSHINDTGDAKPVQQVSFLRVIEFCNRLSIMEGFPPVYSIDGANVTWDTRVTGYRLPTEAEWEYSARAGRSENYSNEEILQLAWVSENSGGRLQEVRQKKPNDWGLYDMFGNINEWCWDLYDADFYSTGPEDNPLGPVTSSFNDRITRGGSFINGADMCNVAIRGSYPASNDNINFNLGFRIARSKIGLSVERTYINQNINISPNPATDYIDISINAVIPAKAGISADIKIYDVLGVCVLTTSPPAPLQIGEGRKVRLDVSGLAAGVYFVRVGDKVLRFVKL